MEPNSLVDTNYTPGYTKTKLLRFELPASIKQRYIYELSTHSDVGKFANDYNFHYKIFSLFCVDYSKKIISNLDLGVLSVMVGASPQHEQNVLSGLNWYKKFLLDGKFLFNPINVPIRQSAYLLWERPTEFPYETLTVEMFFCFYAVETRGRNKNV